MLVLYYGTVVDPGNRLTFFLALRTLPAGVRWRRGCAGSGGDVWAGRDGDGLRLLPLSSHPLEPTNDFSLGISLRRHKPPSIANDPGVDRHRAKLGLGRHTP